MNYFLSVTLPDWIRENIVFKFKDARTNRPTPLAKFLLWVFAMFIVVAGLPEFYLYRNNFDRMVVVDVYSRSSTMVLDAAQEACGVEPTPGAGHGSFKGELYAWQLETVDGENHIFAQYHTLNVPIEGNWEQVTMFAGENVYMQSGIPEGEIQDAVYQRALKETKPLNYITVISPVPDETKLHTQVTVRCVRYAPIDWTFWN